MYFYKYLLKLISIIILFALITVVNAESNIKPKPVDITIIKGNIFINNTKISTPATIYELNKLLGKFTRSTEIPNFLTWDSSGVRVIYDNKKVAGELQIFIKKRTPFEKAKLDPFGELSIDMRPIHDFSGRLSIDDFEITEKTSIYELNYNRKNSKFKKDAIHNTYSRGFGSTKNYRCSIYIHVTDNNNIYQINRSCEKRTINKINKTENDIDGYRASMDANARKLHQEVYNLSDTQLIEFEKRLAEYKLKKQKTFIKKVKEIDTKLEKGEITKKQAEQLAMQLLYPRLTSEKIAAQDNARQEIKKNKDKMTKKDQAALEAGFNMMMLKDIFSGDSYEDKAIQKIADKVKIEITN